MIAPRLRYDGRSPSPPTTELSGTDALKKIATLTQETHMTTTSDTRKCPGSSRSLRMIAAEIHRLWPKPYFGAVPYIEAMGCLSTITDSYGSDSGDSIVRYFLANAGTWRGDHARRIKAELKGMLT